MKRLPALLTMSVISAVILIAWMLTVDVWVEKLGLRPSPDPAGAAGVARATQAGLRPTSRQVRRVAKSRPTTRKVIPESAPSDEDGEPAGWIYGRIVNLREHAPAPRANVRLRLADADGYAWPLSDVAEEDGRFEIAIPKAAFATASLEVESARHSGLRSFAVAPPFAGDRNLGDVELADFRTIWFSVLTPSVDPVPRAIVRTEPESGKAEYADHNGTGSIEIAPDVAKLRVFAFGYEITDVPVPPSEDSMRMTLKPATTLTIHVTTNAGEPRGDRMSLTISGESPPCEIFPGDPVWRLVGNSVPARHAQDHLLFERAIVAKLTYVQPGVPLTIVARDMLPPAFRSGDPREAGSVRTTVRLAPGEHRDVELLIPGDYRRLCGRIVGAGERPVAGATVDARSVGSCATDARGSFDFGASLDRQAWLTVRSPSYAEWKSELALPGAKESPPVIQLEAGRSITVSVVDADGRAVEGALVICCDRRGASGPDGKVVLHHVPTRPVHVEASCSYRSGAECPAGNNAITVRLENLKR